MDRQSVITPASAINGYKHGVNIGLLARRGNTTHAPASYPGTGQFIGPTRIRMFLITRSGQPPTTTATGHLYTTTFSMASSSLMARLMSKTPTAARMGLTFPINNMIPARTSIMDPGNQDLRSAPSARRRARFVKSRMAASPLGQSNRSQRPYSRTISNAHFLMT